SYSKFAYHCVSPRLTKPVLCVRCSYVGFYSFVIASHSFPIWLSVKLIVNPFLKGRCPFFDLSSARSEYFYSAVTGSIMVEISVTTLAGKLPCLACSLTIF